jgi:hypothetical protein
MWLNVSIMTKIKVAMSIMIKKSSMIVKLNNMLHTWIYLCWLTQLLWL